MLELKPKHPSRAVCVVECDLELDFAPPLDYVEPPKDYGKAHVQDAPSAVMPSAEKLEEQAVREKVFQPYQGEGKRLDGKNDKAIPSVGPVVRGPTDEAGRREAERKARANAAAARFAPGRMRFSRPADVAAPPTGTGSTDDSADAKEASPAPASATDWSKLSKGRTLRD